MSTKLLSVEQQSGVHLGSAGQRERMLAVRAHTPRPKHGSPRRGRCLTTSFRGQRAARAARLCSTRTIRARALHPRMDRRPPFRLCGVWSVRVGAGVGRVRPFRFRCFACNATDQKPPTQTHLLLPQSECITCMRTF